MTKITPSVKEVKYCVVSSFNRAFSPVYIPLLISLKKNLSLDLNLDIVLLVDGVSDFIKEEIDGIAKGRFSVRFVEGSEFIEDVNCSSFLGKWPLSSVYRLWIPLKFSGYEKVLYLDCDTIVKKDFSCIFEESGSDGHSIAAVRDFSVRNPSLFEGMCSHVEALLGERKNDYVNSGVVVFNFPFNEDLYKKDLVESIRKCNTGRFPDQDVLNVLFDGKKVFLSDRYNVQMGYYEQDRALVRRKGFDLEDIAIAHFTGKSKPWSTFLEHDIYAYYWEVVLETRVASYLYLLNTSMRLRQIQKVKGRRWRWFLKFVFCKSLSFLFSDFRKKVVGYETFVGDDCYLRNWEKKIY